MTTPSSTRTRTHTRMRSIAVISAGAVVAGLLGTAPASSAAPGGDFLVPVTTGRPAMPPGRYVVLLKSAAAASYRGGIPSLDATRAAPGRSFDARTTAVRAYTTHLRSEQNRLARSVGATVQASYTIAANGFAARLTSDQAAELAADRDVLLVAPDRARKVDTWNTPSFLGLSGKGGAWRAQAGGASRAGQGTVVGVIDSGIWPESKSFAGRPLTSKPKTRWDISRDGTSTTMEKADGGIFRGECQTSHDGEPAQQWNLDDCSTKVVGARYYPDAFLDFVDPSHWSPTERISARDGDGHGSHTASTAAGRTVKRVKVDGTAFGTVSGVAPGARIAVYKVCFDDDDEATGGCYESSILDAIDDAVADGVDAINFSISGAVDTVIDLTEIAFEGAAEAGVFVAASAGNSGPDPSTVAHNSPWLTTVAAGTHVNSYNTVVLGNGRRIRGASIAGTPVPRTKLVESTAVAATGAPALEATLCKLGSLAPAKVTGKIVLCTRGTYDRVEKSAAVAAAGGVGMILANPSENSTVAEFHSVPTVHLTQRAAGPVFRYVEAQGNKATAAIKLGDRTGRAPDPLPVIAGFSSRGPALANDGDLLKPDITAPGVDILAAVSPPSNSGRKYNLESGTSMASPHIAGLAAFVMAEHPFWTPMQVKSAMMTTASSLREEDGTRSRDLFAQGAGQVRPPAFADPGLFVTSDATDWRRFLVGQGLDLGDDYEPLAAKDLNGPSMADGDVVGSTSFTREFTSTRKGTWKVSVRVPGFAANTANTLVAKRPGDHESLTIRLSRTTAPFGRYAMGYLQLTGPTRVRLPIAVQPERLAAPAEVAGTGTSAAVEVSLRSADGGSLDLTPNGLAESTFAESTVAEGDFDAYCVPVSAGAKVARFDLDSIDDTADMDLFVIPADAGCLNAVGEPLSSATSAADEQVTVPNPAAASYYVEVDGWRAADGETTMDYRLDVFDVPPGPGLGDFTATPNPLPVASGVEATYEASWTGLDPDARYMGVMDYVGTSASTYVTVDTR